MANVVLHIGTHKTATTTVQDTFYHNRALLADHGIIYPALGLHTGHHGLLTDWIALPAAYRLPCGGLGTLRALAAEYVDSDKTLFLSSEEFSRGGGTGGQVDMAVLRQVFEGYENIRVICTLREQWQFLQSVYLELARCRIPDRPPILIETAIRTGMVDGLWCDYRALYDHLLTGFSPETIRFVDFNAACESSGGVLGTMLSMLELPFGVEALEPINNGVSNASALALPSWAGLTIAGGHTFGPDLFSIVQTAFDIEYGQHAKSCLFTRKELELISGRYTQLNEELTGRVAPFQPEFSISEKPPEEDTVYREDIGASFWLRAARRIYLSSSDMELS